MNTNKEMEMQTVGSVAARWGISPSALSILFYRRAFPGQDATCPVVAGRRMIPVDYMPTIESVLRRKGLISAAARPGR